MNTRYCSSCGTPNKWDVQKPRFCGKCSNDMDSAFKATVPPVSVTVSQPKQQAAASQRITRKFFDAYGNDVTDQFIKQAPQRPQRAEGDEDYVDEYEKTQLTNELAASISAADFSLSIDLGESKSVKLGSIIQQAVQNQPVEISPKKRGRKKTNG